MLSGLLNQLYKPFRPNIVTRLYNPALVKSKK